MVFQDQVEAGQALAGKLLPYKDEEAMVLATSRGGVVIGSEIAKTLGGAPLDIVFLRSLYISRESEFETRRISPEDIVLLNKNATDFLRLIEAYTSQPDSKDANVLKQSLRQFHGDRPLSDIRGRTVILVDDGFTIGMVLEAIIRGLNRIGPRKLILAVPVGVEDMLETLQVWVTQWVALETTVDFTSVSLWYRHLKPITDAELDSLLIKARRKAYG